MELIIRRSAVAFAIIRRSLFSIVAALVCMILGSQVATAAPGDLDAGFGTGGKALTNFLDGEDVPSAVSIQPDGKIVVAGYAQDSSGIGSGRYLAVSRYNPDGSPDLTFGVAGKAIHDFGFLGFTVAMTIQDDGKIVVVGTIDQLFGNSDFAVFRLDPNGSPDPTFGVNGTVTTDFFGSYDGATAVSVQSDGKLVVAGLVQNAGLPTDFAVARYHSNGDLDQSFGTGGKVTTDFGGQADIAHDLAIQPDGKIVVAGVADVSNIGVARYETNGDIDILFGNSGTVSSNGYGSQDLGHAVAVQADGKIVVGGKADDAGTTGDFFLIRYDPSGDPDQSFGSEGKVTTDFFGFGEVINDIVIQDDGKIVAVGLVTVWADLSGGDLDFGIARYETNGDLDLSFGSGGKVTTPILDSEAAEAAAIDSNCNIVVAGFSSPPNSSDVDFALVRYDGGGCISSAPCPLGHGFWKNDPVAWPVESLVIGGKAYTKTELQMLLKDATNTDASIILARQLIAAKLNLANGSDAASIQAAIDSADSILSGYNGKLPLKVKPPTPGGQAMVNAADLLDSYNNGALTPNCSL